MASYILSPSSLRLLPPDCCSISQKPCFSFQPTSQFLPLKPLPQQLKRQSSLFSSESNFRRRSNRQPRLGTVVAAQSNILKVLQTVWKVGKDGVDAGTNLVPVPVKIPSSWADAQIGQSLDEYDDSIPRPVARISVTGAAVALSLFVFKSFLSTVSFVLAMMGLIYFVFIALNKNEGPRGDGGSTTISEDDSLEEARRIMEKYK